MVTIGEYFRDTIQNSYTKRNILILSAVTFLLLNLLLISPNFDSHFGRFFSKVFFLKFLQDVYASNLIFGIGLLILITIFLILVVFLYAAFFSYLTGFYRESSKNQQVLALIMLVWVLLLLILNFLENIPPPLGYQLTVVLLVITLLGLCYKNLFMYIRQYLESYENRFLALVLVAIFIFSLALRLVLVGPAYDIHADEAYYLTEGRLLTQGIISIGYDHYPLLPVLLSIGLGINPTIETASLFLIVINSFIPLAGYAFGSSLYDNKKVGIAFAIILVFSPFLILYSNRAFMDPLALLLFLLIGDALIKRRNPLYVGILGTLLFMDKLQYVLEGFFFLSLLLWSKKLENRRLDLNHFIDWILRSIGFFLVIFSPIFIVLKWGLLTGQYTDPNVNFLGLLSEQQIFSNFSQYFNWAALRTTNLDGSTGNDTIIYLLALFSLLIISIIGVIQIFRQKKLTPLIFPLLSFATLLTPQLFILSRYFQRYALFLHAFTFMLPIAIVLEMLVSTIFYIGKWFFHEQKYKNIRVLVSPIPKYLLLIVFCLLISFPLFTLYYPDLPEQNLSFEVFGYRQGAEYIVQHYNQNTSILGVDDGWRAGWFFPNMQTINLIDNNGIQTLLSMLQNTSLDKTVIIYAQTYYFPLILGNNTSKFQLLTTFQWMGLYLFNTSL